jgi:amino-acid N-acetyltransferase
MSRRCLAEAAVPRCSSWENLSMESITYSFATPADKNQIRQLLSECGLPTVYIARHLKSFMVARGAKKLVGVIGLEVYGREGLLRSLCVEPAYRGRGIARGLNARILAYAHLRRIDTLYLFTVKAVRFSAKLGFKKVDKKRIPKTIQTTWQFRSFHPYPVVCMMKKISDEAHYYPRETLSLKADVPGAEMWGVSLDQTMLTYFEVKPCSRFSKHSHKSEQITLVLKGELFFRVNNRILCVKEGEVIAIPSHVPHSVYTQNKPVKAIDAWSPVMRQYIGKQA